MYTIITIVGRTQISRATVAINTIELSASKWSGNDDGPVGVGDGTSTKKTRWMMENAQCRCYVVPTCRYPTLTCLEIVSGTPMPLSLDRDVGVTYNVLDLFCIIFSIGAAARSQFHVRHPNRTIGALLRAPSEML